MGARRVVEQITARATSDGAGVNLLRAFGGARPERFDPFLLMDEFGSDKPDDYSAGFPAHPHRGFQTITYMLEGKMEHRDHLGNVGLLSDGGVQWMTAGRGVIHSEMPKQTEGKMHGFQIWLNLPAKSKLQPAYYQDVAATKLPRFSVKGAQGVAIAGTTQINETPAEGYFHVDTTEAVYLDVHIDASADLSFALDHHEQVLIYTYEGQVRIGEQKALANARQLSRLEKHGDVAVSNTSDNAAKFILLAGKPLREKIAQYGPFVMNTAEEIEQAIRDYSDGTLVS